MAERIITRTVYGAVIQTVKQLGLPHIVLDYTTINEAINEETIISHLPADKRRGMEIIDPYDYENDTNRIFTQWLVIGNGGHENINNPNDAVPYSIPIPHKATDSGLFSIIPFLLRPATADLTTVERAKYGLRRTVVIDDVVYAAYYARKLEFPQYTPDMILSTVENGQESTEQFVPTIENLRPEKYGDSTQFEGKYVSVSSMTTVTFSAAEIQDLKDAARLMFGNERMAIISELAICSAVSKMVSARYPYVTASAMNPIPVPANMYWDIAACQVNTHITTYVPISFVDQEYSLSLNLGATEALFGEQISNVP